MIPKIIHFCWFGGGEKPELVQRCIASWHRFMPDWQYMEWNEQTVEEHCAAADIPHPITHNLYANQAYQARKYAFVSDVVRLWALEQFGGLYMDADFEVFRDFSPLLDCPEGAFVGREGSKRQPPMLGVMAAEPHSPWIQAMSKAYEQRTFIVDSPSSRESGKGGDTYDLTTNVSYFDALGVHRPEWVHIYPVDYFCPVLTTGERVDSPNTYCEHKGLHSWSPNSKGIKAVVARFKHWLLSVVGADARVRLIKLKRKIFG